MAFALDRVIDPPRRAGEPSGGAALALAALRDGIPEQLVLGIGIASGVDIEKFGMTAETLRGWVRQAAVDDGRRPPTTTAAAERIKELERGNRELRRVKEILTAASAFFARELDPQPPKR